MKRIKERATHTWVISVNVDDRFCGQDCPYLKMKTEYPPVSSEKPIHAAKCTCFNTETPLTVVEVGVWGKTSYKYGILRSYRCYKTPEEKA